MEEGQVQEGERGVGGGVEEQDLWGKEEEEHGDPKNQPKASAEAKMTERQYGLHMLHTTTTGSKSRSNVDYICPILVAGGKLSKAIQIYSR